MQLLSSLPCKSRALRAPLRDLDSQSSHKPAPHPGNRQVHVDGGAQDSGVSSPRSQHGGDNAHDESPSPTPRWLQGHSRTGDAPSQPPASAGLPRNRAAHGVAQRQQRNVAFDDDPDASRTNDSLRPRSDMRNDETHATRAADNGISQRSGADDKQQQALSTHHPWAASWHVLQNWGRERDTGV